MKREEAIATLRAHERDLRSAGVVLSASLFKPVSRYEAGPGSDVDVVVKVFRGFAEGGLDYVRRRDELTNRFSVILSGKVDVVVEPFRRERLRVEIYRDCALAL